MHPTHGYGMADFVTQSDIVGRAALVILLVMSLVTWFIVVRKAIVNLRENARARAHAERFRTSRSIETARALSEAGDSIYGRLTRRFADAMRGPGTHDGLASLARNDTLARIVRGAIAEQQLAWESGLTILASIGATAPFVGLFGTVWGVYNALVQIGMTGQGTLDKVAGPVGEALIMTALGLAVAIPAVLAYNAFARRNRLALARLDAYATELFVLATAAPAAPQPGRPA